ncbi:heparan sulfate glucosamine 3-O-sulfotransferase 1-like [Apostichopus japonicus]|uniref:heparan sulfate glucosamine 3-O-sulfotransferase 1-like n=1 Tax=Stichopus japonicus TaxID=307972 RepID=UPI003AB90C39
MALIQISSFSMFKSRRHTLEIFVIFVVGVWFFTSVLEEALFSDDADDDTAFYHRLFEGNFHDKRKRNFTCYNNDDPFSQDLFPAQLLEERGCEQRLPNVLIAGVKYCRTDVLTSLLRHHPYLAFPKLTTDVSYFNEFYDLGTQWYQSQVGYSIEDQLTVDASPSYFTDHEAPARIKSDLSNTTKIIVLFCDPVERALREIKDVRHDEFELLSDMEVRAEDLDNPFIRNDEQHDLTLAEIFENNSSLKYIKNGIYVNFFYEWYQHLPPSAFFMLGEGRLFNETEKVLTKLETFLKVPSYFSSKIFRDPFQNVICIRNNFKFDSYCFSRDNFLTRQNMTKLEKLRDFYRPYNDKLQKLFLVPVL